MKSTSPLPLCLLLLVLTAGCVNAVTEDNRPCPCTEGWTCCESTGLCTQDAASCAPTPPRDTEPPAAPVLKASIPGSPTANPIVTLDGTAEPGAIVHLFTTSDCTGPVVGSGAAGGSGTFRIQGALSANASTSFHARALDEARNVSPCSAEPLTVLHDSLAPEAPVLERLTPGALSSSSQPLVEGRAEPASTVRLYTDAGCSTALPPTATVDDAGAFSVRVSVEPHSTTTFHARAFDAAGNGSPCAPVGLRFTHDGTPPEAPLFVGPTLLSAGSTTRAVGETEPGTQVRLFTRTDCTGDVLTEGPALADGTFSLPFAMKPNTTVVLSAHAVDAAGNASACSQPLAVLHDDIAPAPPSVLATEPVSPSNKSLTPFVTGRAEPGSTVLVYLGVPTCEASSARRVFTGTANAQGNYRVLIEAEANTTNRLSVAARDAVGNVSPCSFPLDYVHDTLPPRPPVLHSASEPSPAAFNSLTTLLGTAEAGMRIDVYADATCSGPLVAWNRSHTWEGWPVTDFSVQFKNEREGTRVYQATATDAAGNTSACSSTSVEHTVTKEGRQWRIAGFPCTTSAYSLVQNAANHYLALCERKPTTTSPPRAEASFRTPELWWEEPVVLSEGGAVSDVRGALSDDGAAFALWLESTGTEGPRVRVRRYVPGGAWQPALTLSGDGLIGSAPALGVDGSGNALALWLESSAQEPSRRALRFSRFTSATGWSAPASLVAAASMALNAHSVRLHVRPSGHAWALWTQGTGAEETLWLSRYVPGADWSTPERLDLSVLGSQPATYAFVADNQGGAVLAWLERGASPEARHVKVRRYVASEGWSAPHVLSQAELPTDPPQVAVNARGEALVGWVHRGADLTAHSLQVARFTPETQWSAPVPVQPGPGPFLATAAGESLWLTLDDTGAGMAFWLRPFGAQTVQLEPSQLTSVLWTSRFEPLSGWKRPQVLFPYGGRTYFSVTTRANAKGDTLVLWRNRDLPDEQFGALELR